MRTLAFHCSTDLERPFIALLHTAEPPDKTEWRGYVSALETMMSKRVSGIVHVFVATSGGGPNAAQRTELANVVTSGAGQALTHVFTDDVVVRGIITAFGWLVRSHAIAHRPSEFSEACREYGFAPTTILEAFTQAHVGFPPMEMLDVFAETLPALQP